MNKNEISLRIRDLHTGRIVHRGITSMPLACLMIREAANRGQSWGWEGE